MGELKRWWCIEGRGTGHQTGRRVLVGRIQATEAEIVKELGPYVEINHQNGYCCVYGKPNKLPQQ